MSWRTLAITLLAAMPVLAVPTKVTVRAVSRDAKVIGTGVGGARITIREVTSGRVLAAGVQLGATGDTKKIMNDTRPRYGTVFGTEGAAAFVAELDLHEPTVVEIVAEGPLKYPQAMQRASKTLLLVPGQDVLGEGVLLELHGFVIDVREATPDKIRMRMVMT